LTASGTCDRDRLEALCGTHPELAPGLRALAEAHQRGSAYLEGWMPVQEATVASAGPSLSFSERYEILREIARGGMGVVLEVWDAQLRRKLAMKCLRRDTARDDPAFQSELARRRARLVNEAQVLAQIEHPGIVPVYDVGLDDRGEIYFTMLRVRGQTLDQVFTAVREGRDGWNLTRVLGVLLRVSEAVAYAHEKGVLHRDLKPSNVMVGELGEAYVMDWGLARARASESAPQPSASREGRAPSASSLVHTSRSDDRASDSSSPLFTQDGEVIGTPAYMSPEQARGTLGEIDHRSDVYSLGAMLYELLAGSAPYARELRDSPAHAVLAASRERAPAPIESLATRGHGELAAICAKAMTRDRHARYATARELAGDLRAYLENRVVRAHHTGALVELRKWTQRNKGAAAAIAAVVLGLGAIAMVETLLKRDLQRAQLETAARAEALRRQDYFNRIALAADAIQDGRSGRARELLDGCPEDLRAFAWRFLDARVDTCDLLVSETPDRWRSVAFAPDGRSVVTVGNRALCIFDATTGEKCREIARFDDNIVGALQFTASGDQLVLMNRAKKLSVWQTGTWSRLPDLAVSVPDSYPNALPSPIGDRIAVFGDGPVEVWDLPRRELLAVLESGQDHVNACWSPDGERLYCGAWDGSLAVWDAKSFKLVHIAHEHGSRVNALAASPDGRWLATTGWDRRVFLWNTETFEVVHRTQAMPVGPLAWSPDASQLAVGAGSSIVLLEADTWLEASRLNGHSDLLTGFAFDRAGAHLVSASYDGEIRVWDLERPDRRGNLGDTRAESVAPCFSRDSRWLAVSWFKLGLVELWSVPDRRCVRSLRLGPRVICRGISDDGNRLLLCIEPGVLAIVDARDERVVARAADLPIGGGAYNPDAVRFSPDGEHISIAGTDGTLSVWHADSLEREWIATAYDGPDAWPFRLGGGVWSSDGTRIATLPCDGGVQLWDAARGELVREWKSRRPTQRAQFSLDGKRLYLSGATVNGIECWDVEKPECLWELAQDSALVLQLGDGGKCLFCVSNAEIDIRDPSTGKLIVSLELDPFLEHGFAISPDANTLVTASTFGLRLWAAQPAR
jgi:WD40 repeat protein/serine/threonine protein kinase